MSSGIFNISFIKNIYSIISSIHKTEQTDIQVLEPLTTIITLAIISFKSVGTKIAVHSNKILVQSPNLVQGVVRWSFGNNREEIHYLLKPILRVVQIYDPDENENIKSLFEYAILGLKVLKDSYNNSSSTLCHTLDLYISIIDNCIKKSNPNLQAINYIENIKDDLNLSQNSKVNLDNLFKGIWKEEEIKLICTMMNLANTDNVSEQKSYIVAIESILSTKEQFINKIIENTTRLLN